ADYVALLLRNLDGQRHALFYRRSGIFLLYLWPPQNRRTQTSGVKYLEHWLSPLHVRRLQAMSSGATTQVRTYQNFVNGKWESAPSGKTFPVYAPSTEEVIAHVAVADPADVDRAVKAARAAFDSGPWPQTTAQDRGRILFKLAEKIRQNSA